MGLSRFFREMRWSKRALRDSNARPLASEANTLSTELRAQPLA